MLGKLFKHEFRTVGKMEGLLLAIAAGVTLLGAVYLASPLFKSVIDETANRDPMTGVIGSILGMLGLMAYVGILVGINFGFMIYLGVRFYKSMYSDEGYLTHTLPVTSTQLLVAKIVTGGTCLLLLTVLLYVMVGGLAVFGIAVATHVSMGEFLKNAAHFMRETISVLETEVGISLTGPWIYIIAALVLSPFANVMILFGALTLGQLSWKNKGLMGVVAYIIIRVVMNLISSVLSFGYQFYALAKRDEAGLEYAMGLTNGKNFVTLGIMLLFALALLFTSNFVVKNRLNLE